MKNDFISKSDLLHVLENMDSLVRLYMEAINETTQRMLAMSIAAESLTLSQKLRAMLKRWEVYLPLHECQDVRFDEWSRILEQRLLSLQRDRQSDEKNGYYEPKNKFWLDLTDDCLYEPFDGSIAIGQDVRAYVARVDERLDELVAADGKHRWAVCDSHPKITDEMLTALKELKELLMELHCFFYAEKSENQYLRLSNRLFVRLCKGMDAEVQNECNKWLVEWPKRHRQAKATEKRELLMAELTDWDEATDRCCFADYCDSFQLNPLEDPEFGQFLFIMRHQLDTEDIIWLFKICLKIQWLNSYIQEIDRPATPPLEVEALRLTSEMQLIWERLMELCEQVEWRNGMTVERMKAGISRMLRVSGEALESKLIPLSKELWRLLLQRPKCRDAEKSFQVTWLNFIGWCQRQQYLAGSSPKLCRSFFLRTEEDAYKAIDKGRNREVKSFEQLLPLLDACLGSVTSVTPVTSAVSNIE